MKDSGKKLIKLFRTLTISALMIGTAVSSLHAWGDSFTITINVDKAPPAKVTDLEAQATVNLGEIKLNWTAPGDDGTEGQLQAGAYFIRYSTRSLSEFSGDTTSWWDNSSLFWDNLWQPKQPGETEEKIFDSLQQGTTYYFAIKSQDEAGKWSDISDISSAMTRYAMDPIDDLIASTYISEDGRVDLNWTSVGGEEYILKYDERPVSDFGGSTVTWWNNAANTYQQAGWTPLSAGQAETFSAVGLTPGVTYYFGIKAKTGSYYSDMSNVDGAAAGDPAPLAPSWADPALDWSDNKVKLDWQANSEPDIAGYRIFRKEGEGAYVIIATVTTTAYDDSDTEINKTYTYKLQAIDDTDHISPDSAEKSITAGQLAVELPDPGYLLIHEVTNNNFTFEWARVVNDQVKGYRIERTADLTSTWTQIDYIYSTATLRYTVPRGGDNIYYYRVRTESWGGSTSAGLMVIDNSDDMNHGYISADRHAWLKVPYTIAQELYPENNGGDFVKMDLERTSDEEDFLLTYDVKAMKNGQEVKDFKFEHSRMGAQIVISYRQLAQAGAISPALTTGKQPVLYWYNGVEWIKLGGTSDAVNSRVYTKSRRLGKYALKFTTLADEFTLNKVVPKIFTPEEGSEVINAVRFYFENPDNKEVTIRIFDISGAEIRSNLRREGENIMVWDGKDKDGDYVRAGIYIYQVECDGKTINGTIVVAK